MLRDNEKNTAPKTVDAPGPETLKFHFTPVDPPKAGTDNPHAKASTNIPDVVEALNEHFGEDVLDVEIYAGEYTVYVAKGRIVDVCRFLRTEHGFTYFADGGGLDRFTEDDRYEVFYNLVNIQDRKRIRLKVRVDEDELVVPSVTGVFRAANWNERETYDMLGIRFDGHPDLRRMYMPEDFEHYPQRKEFPLLGIPGSLPLPPRVPEGELTTDPFAAARQGPTLKSYQEPKSAMSQDED